MIIKTSEDASLMIDDQEAFKNPFLNVDVHRRRAVFRCTIAESEGSPAEKDIGYNIMFEPIKFSVTSLSMSVNLRGVNVKTNAQFNISLSVGMKTDGLVVSGIVNGKKVNQSIGTNILTLIKILEG